MLYMSYLYACMFVCLYWYVYIRKVVHVVPVRMYVCMFVLVCVYMRKVA
jgi:hypothetical protein